MAGMPPVLLNRANEILKQLEESRDNQDGVKENLHHRIKKIAAPKMQLSIFDAHTETFEEIRKLLEHIDIDRLTPVEALLRLEEIKGLLK
jgi:DNA mismatch repair protein MutS